MLLRVDHLMVFFENALAVNDLSLEVAAGEIRGVVGSNSAGAVERKIASPSSTGPTFCASAA